MTAPMRPPSDRSIMPCPRHFGVSPPYCKTPATIATMASETGRNTFQPSRISWSYRYRGTIAFTMANRKKMNRHLSTNQITPGTQVNAATGEGGIQPPRKRIVAIAHMVAIAMYSPRKNSRNAVAEYSTAKPATSSDSASTRSNGGRFVSANADTKNTTNIGNNGSQYHSNSPYLPSCASTMAESRSEPATSSTVMNTKPMETS